MLNHSLLLFSNSHDIPLIENGSYPILKKYIEEFT